MTDNQLKTMAIRMNMMVIQTIWGDIPCRIPRTDHQAKQLSCQLSKSLEGLEVSRSQGHGLVFSDGEVLGAS